MAHPVVLLVRTKDHYYKKCLEDFASGRIVSLNGNPIRCVSENDSIKNPYDGEIHFVQRNQSRGDYKKRRRKNSGGPSWKQNGVVTKIRDENNVVRVYKRTLTLQNEESDFKLWEFALADPTTHTENDDLLLRHYLKDKPHNSHSSHNQTPINYSSSTPPPATPNPAPNPAPTNLGTLDIATTGNLSPPILSPTPINEEIQPAHVVQTPYTTFQLPQLHFLQMTHSYPPSIVRHEEYGGSRRVASRQIQSPNFAPYPHHQGYNHTSPILQNINNNNNNNNFNVNTTIRSLAPLPNTLTINPTSFQNLNPPINPHFNSSSISNIGNPSNIPPPNTQYYNNPAHHNFLGQTNNVINQWQLPFNDPRMPFLGSKL
ncbi:hypothetical protein PPL_09148 [Heterostelium album PN500]|uniref:NAC domain-containing protein n=1 Tax=Heterostelium pallidum (strain ATCC 26659 / Pp 5 / PN500) TaxID=670386 RepID=D3BKR6_HETP5|nr:hypothetical protein PPL_09148 [Heterostelium album PN500]EFA78496.1 hypothetical protein PPL_09148 [Heterostelium album PN500]|eukprot:XP_020430620.1 hypothetical protein PPL_09148 [Heterostelium album PN500]